MAAVLVVGDLALDRAVYLNHPLTSGRDQAGERTAGRPGGTGANVARALAAAGHRVRLASTVGEDRAGAVLLADLVRRGVDTSLVRMAPGTRTRERLVLVAPGGERTVVTLRGGASAIPRADRLGDVADVRAALVLDSRPFTAAESARVRSILSLLPPDTLRMSGWPTSAPWPVDIVLTSRRELPDVERDPYQHLREATGGRLRWAVVTDGSLGAVVYAGEHSMHQGTNISHPLDCTGAGAAFAAGFLHTMLERRDAERALIAGNAWAASAARLRSSAPPPPPWQRGRCQAPDRASLSAAHTPPEDVQVHAE